MIGQFEVVVQLEIAMPIQQRGRCLKRALAGGRRTAGERGSREIERMPFHADGCVAVQTAAFAAGDARVRFRDAEDYEEAVVDRRGIRIAEPGCRERDVPDLPLHAGAERVRYAVVRVARAVAAGQVRDVFMADRRAPKRATEVARLERQLGRDRVAQLREIADPAGGSIVDVRLAAGVGEA
jgi:hypothetical protein